MAGASGQQDKGLTGKPMSGIGGATGGAGTGLLTGGLAAGGLNTNDGSLSGPAQQSQTPMRDRAKQHSWAQMRRNFEQQRTRRNQSRKAYIVSLAAGELPTHAYPGNCPSKQRPSKDTAGEFGMLHAVKSWLCRAELAA